MSNKEYDVIVIGGGATGSGIALDAASRGFKTLIVEQNDFGEGTTSRSTKLVHGGVRYLEAAVKKLDKSQYDLVKEALKERYILLKNAPHISKKLQLVTPIYKWWELPYMFIGLSLYDFLSGQRGLGRSKILSKKTTIETFPHVKKEGLVGSVEYFDGSFNDSKLNIALLKSAKEYGAECKNHHKVKGFLYKDEKVSGVIVEDKIENKNQEYFGKVIINGTGLFSDGVRLLDNKESKKMLDLSSGIHIVLDKKYLPFDKGLMIPKTKDGRVLFILPWMGKCLVGTTDESTTAQEHPEVDGKDIEYLLEHLALYFDLDIKKEDILSSWCGIRPLVSPEDSNDTSSIVREHAIFKSKSNLISVVGGKWTTYRKMAEEALDYAIRNSTLEQRECKTENLKLVGSQNFNEEELNLALKVDQDIKEYLISMYGDKSLTITNKSQSLKRLLPTLPYTKEELLYCLEDEFVEKPLDFIVRGTSLSLIDQKGAIEILDSVVEIMKDYFSWSDEYAQNQKNEALALLKTNF